MRYVHLARKLFLADSIGAAGFDSYTVALQGLVDGVPPVLSSVIVH